MHLKSFCKLIRSMHLKNISTTPQNHRKTTAKTSQKHFKTLQDTSKHLKHLKTPHRCLTKPRTLFRYHGIAASMNMLNNMLLSHYTNHSGGEIYTTYWPFQTLGDSLTQVGGSTPVCVCGCLLCVVLTHYPRLPQ